MRQDTHFILLAHGSPDPRWRGTFEAGLAAIRPRLVNNTSLAYMEMASPTLHDVIRGEYEQGTTRYIIVPLFFAAGRHLLEDVPRQIDELKESFANIDIELRDAVGENSAFWEFLADALNGQALIPT